MKYKLLLLKIDDTIKWQKYNTKYTTLPGIDICYIDVSRIFTIKSLLFSLEKALRQHSNNVIFLEEISVMSENEIWFFPIGDYLKQTL